MPNTTLEDPPEVAQYLWNILRIPFRNMGLAQDGNAHGYMQHEVKVQSVLNPQRSMTAIPSLKSG